MDMSVTTPSCADVEARDLEANYLAGTLSADDAAAYEAHYFGCDDCWRSLHRATELRAAFSLPEQLPNLLPKQRPARRARRWGFAAAAVLVIAVGAGVFMREPVDDPESRTTLRGANDAFTVRASTEARATRIAWGAVPDADRYVVRLYRADGQLVLERETADTSFALSADSLPPQPGSDALYWQVLALDRLRQSLARSPLTAAPPSASR